MDYQINEQITAKEVRLIGADGKQHGIYNLADALLIAEEAKLDLVNISPTATPPVCKVVDYGKFLYEQNRKEKEIRRNQKIVETKEVRFSARIDEHDFQTKSRNIQKFLKNGNRVKLSVQFKGREIAHSEIGLNILLRLATEVESFGSPERTPKLEGRQMIMFLNPKVS
ncbi:translation initiation factor IF-3 [Paenibacillus sp. 1182]|uniref:translation initiation factor IF-3 n=1 Tax=Paenibacillus sp. 1182 TaxID=2806565 RepID=UPI001AE4FC52|nr:translation initiation factor IF-3 [Paenibacillus sp. 1182]MBP1308904.1 translation initiation factor IF-3 [Paenibacillus sp. 1182]